MINSQIFRFNSYSFCLLFFFSIATYSYSQKSSDTRTVKIYNKGGLSVDVEFKIYKDPCSNNGKSHKYKYLISGSSTNANKYIVWKLDLKDCNGGGKTITRSIDVSSTQVRDMFIESIDWKFNSLPFDPKDIYGVTASYREVQEDERIVVKNNILPDEILVKNSKESVVSNSQEISYGEEISLSFIGGELSSGANWIWFLDDCEGTKLGEGDKINLTVVEDMNVYLSIIGGLNEVDCISKEVNVNIQSTLPSKINSPDIICKGSSAELSIDDGYLGPDSKWEWFESSCEGKKIGEGEKITVEPSADTKYYVKASGENPTTNCLVKIVKIAEKENSILPKKIEVPSNVCEGDYITLKVLDGVLAEGAKWVWYFTQDGKNKTKVGAGNNKLVYPSKSGFYSLTSEGACGLSDKYVVSNKMNYHEKKYSYQYLNVSPKNPIEGQKVEVSVNEYDKEDKWSWKLDSKELKTSKHKITFKSKSSTYVRCNLNGMCEDDEISTMIYPKSKSNQTYSPVVKEKKITRWYSQTGNYRKTIHFGANVGVFGTYKNYSLDIAGVNYDLEKYVHVGGFEYQLTFHPIIRNKFSLGANFNHQIGTDFMSFWNELIYENYTLKKLNNFRIGSSMAFGHRKYKVLLAYHKSFEDLAFQYLNDRTTALAPTNYSYIQNIDDEFKLGVRLLPYSNFKSKRGVTIDILFSLFHHYNLHNSDGRSSSRSFIEGLSYGSYDKSNFMYGAEFNLWMQSGLGLNFRYHSKNRSNMSSGFENYYQMSLLWNFDFFR